MRKDSRDCRAKAALGSVKIVSRLLNVPTHAQRTSRTDLLRQL